MTDPIIVTHASKAVRCRCGTRISAGELVFGLAHVPASLKGLFHTGVFCSVRCIHSFCLESLDSLDVIDTADSRSMAVDLREVHGRVHEMMATMLGE